MHFRLLQIHDPEPLTDCSLSACNHVSSFLREVGRRYSRLSCL